MPLTLKDKVFAELNKRVDEDYINAVNEIKTIFNLSHEQFHEIYRQWRNFYMDHYKI